MDKDLRYILIILALVLVIGGPIALYNVIYGSIWFIGLVIQIAVELFPTRVVLYIVLPILLAVGTFIASFYHWRRYA
jgi:hypothetical protein